MTKPEELAVAVLIEGLVARPDQAKAVRYKYKRWEGDIPVEYYITLETINDAYEGAEEE